MKSTQQVLDSHIASFLRGDLAGILSDYAPDAILFTPDGPLRGQEAIRPLFTAMLEEFGKPGSRFELDRQYVDGEHGYILWSARTADRIYELATDTFVVRGGKIAVQSFAASVRPLS